MGLEYVNIPFFYNGMPAKNIDETIVGLAQNYDTLTKYGGKNLKKWLMKIDRNQLMITAFFIKNRLDDEITGSR